MDHARVGAFSGSNGSDLGRMPAIIQGW